MPVKCRLFLFYCTFFIQVVFFFRFWADAAADDHHDAFVSADFVLLLLLLLMCAYFSLLWVVLSRATIRNRARIFRLFSFKAR